MCVCMYIYNNEVGRSGSVLGPRHKYWTMHIQKECHHWRAQQFHRHNETAETVTTELATMGMQFGVDGKCSDTSGGISMERMKQPPWPPPCTDDSAHKTSTTRAHTHTRTHTPVLPSVVRHTHTHIYTHTL